MTRSRAVSLLILTLAVALAAFAVWRMSTVGRPVVAPTPARAAEPEPAPDAGETAEIEPLPRQAVQIYFPGVEGNGLVVEEREIFGTPTPGDRAKQILSDLIGGPATQRATRALPPGTQLHQVYVLANGTAWVDFSSDLRDGIGGGSSQELLTVFSIVDSLALNIREIERVGLLIEGKPIETLNGHLDLRRPLAPDRSLVVGGKRAEDSVVVQAGERR